MFPSKVILVSCFILQLSWLLDHGGMEGNPRSTYQTNTYCFYEDLIVDANSFSDGELLLDGHTASASVFLIIPFTWASHCLSVPGMLHSLMVLTCLGLSVCRMPMPPDTHNVITIVASPHKNQKVPEGSAQTSLLEKLVFEEEKKKRSCLFPSTPEGTSKDIATNQEAETSLGSTG